MKIITLFVLLLSQIAQAQIIFLDINNNPYEKREAIKAAKRAGKKIVVYPKDDSEFHLEEAFKILKKNSNSDSLFISGHDGGGSFGGDRGESFSIEDLKEFVQTNKELKNNIKVLGLLGCNTANHSQISKWQNVFPNVSFIAGYDGIGPSGKQPMGWDFIRDTILKTDSILNEASSKKLERTFKNFKNVRYLAATLYADLNKCGGDGEFIYRPLNQGFKPFDTAGCKVIRDSYDKKYKEKYKQYVSGELAIPEKTSSGHLREMYTFMRQSEHCFEKFNEEGNYPTADELLFLLFSHSVHKNFFKYYKDDLNDFFKELESFGDLGKLKEYQKKAIFRLEQELKQKRAYKSSKKILIADLKRYQAILIKNLFSNTSISENRKSLMKQMIENQSKSESSRRSFIQRNISAINQLFEEEDSFSTIYQIGYKLNNKDSLNELHKEFSNNESIEYTEDDIKNLKEESSVSHLKSDYDNLKAKNLADLKKLSRKDLLEFTHSISSFAYTKIQPPSSEFTSKLVDIINDIPVNFNPKKIPFNWHDAHIKRIEDPKDRTYTTEHLKNVKNDSKESKFPVFDSYFGY